MSSFFGGDYLNRITEATSNKIAKCFSTFGDRSCDWLECNKLHPSITFKLPIKRDRFDKGINNIADFLGAKRTVIPMEEIAENLNVKTNFLEYNSINTIINIYKNGTNTQTIRNHFRETVLLMSFYTSVQKVVLFCLL